MAAGEIQIQFLQDRFFFLANATDVFLVLKYQDYPAPHVCSATDFTSLPCHELNPHTFGQSERKRFPWGEVRLGGDGGWQGL